MKPMLRCLALLALAGCDFLKSNYIVDGVDIRDYPPHEARSFRQTPGGHLRDAGPFDSVAGGFVTEDEIDTAVDAEFDKFYQTFPEFGQPKARVHLTDDYVFWYKSTWAGGAEEAGNLFICIHSRGTSDIDPGAQFIKRAPDQNYKSWRFTTGPLVPALRHELLHKVIGDGMHSRPEWKRL